jgi:deazaflavin-dependent oxidoreductase (nitroreductase family)
MARSDEQFHEPNAIERIVNRAFGALVGLGLGLSHNYLLEVRGRKTGRIYSTPIDLLEAGGRRYLVSPRGRSQWVRNVEASGHTMLRRGSARHEFAIRALSDTEKPEILKAYLDRFKTTVQRYFPIPAGSPVAAFDAIAGRYPVFELLPEDASSSVSKKL